MKKKYLSSTRGFAPGLFVAAIALGAFGACFINVSVQTSSLKEFSRTWSSAPARITGLEMAGQTGKPEPVVHYTFWKDGREIQNSRVFLAGGPIEDAEESEWGIQFAYRDAQGRRIEKKYFKNGETEVYYNPHRPEECVLIREVLRDMKPYFFWGIGLVILAFVFLVKCLYDE